MNKNMRLAVVGSATVLILTGCGQRQDCVDNLGRILPSSACSGGGYSGYSYPHWIYGGRSVGGRIVGGSTTSSSTSRGGFGGHGGSFGG